MSNILRIAPEIPEQIKPVQPGEILISLDSVKQRTGFATSFIYCEIRENRFPRPVKIGPKASRWVLSEIDQWIAGRIACRDAGMQPKAAMQAIQ